jgi:hypothetical protein
MWLRIKEHSKGGDVDLHCVSPSWELAIIIWGEWSFDFGQRRGALHSPILAIYILFRIDWLFFAVKDGQILLYRGGEVCSLSSQEKLGPVLEMVADQGEDPSLLCLLASGRAARVRMGFFVFYHGIFLFRFQSQYIPLLRDRKPKFWTFSIFHQKFPPASDWCPEAVQIPKFWILSLLHGMSHFPLPSGIIHIWKHACM